MFGRKCMVPGSTSTPIGPPPGRDVCVADVLDGGKIAGLHAMGTSPAAGRNWPASRDPFLELRGRCERCRIDVNEPLDDACAHDHRSDVGLTQQRVTLLRRFQAYEQRPRTADGDEN